ncbi:MAG: hypothetical protein RLZZ79_278 [Actinomycetota bacterium]
MNSFQRFVRSPRTQATMALFLSIAVGIGTYFYLLGYQARVASSNELVPVYVAKSEIASGTSYAEIVAGALMETKEFPSKSLPSGVITPDESVEATSTTKGPLAPGQLLVASYFTQEANPNLALEIPNGSLAVTISVDDVSRVGNFVLPGSRVVIFTTDSNSSGQAVTKVLMPEALVIGIGNQTGLNLSSTTPVPSPLVTVAVSPSDAQRLIQASKSSQITLALAYENDPYSLVGTSKTSISAFNSGS